MTLRKSVAADKVTLPRADVDVLRQVVRVAVAALRQPASTEESSRVAFDAFHSAVSAATTASSQGHTMSPGSMLCEWLTVSDVVAAVNGLGGLDVGAGAGAAAAGASGDDLPSDDALQSIVGNEDDTANPSIVGAAPSDQAIAVGALARSVAWLLTRSLPRRGSAVAAALVRTCVQLMLPQL